MVEGTIDYDESEGRNTEGGVGVGARLLCSRVVDEEVIAESMFGPATRALLDFYGSPGEGVPGAWVRADDSSGEGFRWGAIY